MTPTEARDLIENDADVGSAIRHAVSVLEEAAILEERERCAAVVEGFQTDQPGVGMSHWGKALATAIREGAPAQSDGGKDADSYKHLPPRGNA